MAADDDVSIPALLPATDFETADARYAHISEMIAEMHLSLRRQAEQPYEIARRDDIDFGALNAELTDPSRRPI